MNYNQWRERYKNRNDITSRLTHLTKGYNTEQAFQNLLKILNDKKLIGSTTESGFIIGKTSAVCFQEAPLHAIAENLQFEKMLHQGNEKDMRYSAFGLRFDKEFIYRQGGRPVIYEQRDFMKEILPPAEHWRIVNYDLSNKEYIIDWSHEREWRIPGDLEFEYANIEVLVASNGYYKKFIEYCTQNDKQEILQQINGVISLNTIFY